MLDFSSPPQKARNLNATRNFHQPTTIFTNRRQGLDISRQAVGHPDVQVPTEPPLQTPADRIAIFTLLRGNEGKAGARAAGGASARFAFGAASSPGARLGTACRGI